MKCVDDAIGDEVDANNLEELAEPPQQMFLSKWFTYGIRLPINYILMPEL